jgi:hemin uptake protein HemP
MALGRTTGLTLRTLRQAGSGGPRAPASAPCSGGTAAKHIRGEELFGAGREVTIEHNQRLYTLRITAQGKLILTA